MEVSSLEEQVPPVGDDEYLARFCDRRNVKAGRPKANVFLASRWPFEISVARTVLCDVVAEARKQKRWYVTLEAGQVRALPHTVVRADPLPDFLAHALIVCSPPSAPAGRMERRTEAEQNARAWAEFIDVVDQLREIAVMPAETTPTT